MKQKILSVLIAAVMVISLMPVSALAARGASETGHNHSAGYCPVCNEGTDTYEAVDPTLEEGMEAAAYIDGVGYPSLRAAVQEAYSGATVQLAKDISLDSSVRINKEINIDGADHTIIRAFDGDAMFNLLNSAKVALVNVTIDGRNDQSGYSLFNVLSGAELDISTGTTLRNSWADYGGGVYVTSGGTLRMTTGRITDCWAENSGGAVYNDGTMFLSGDASITNNRAYWGGGVRSGGEIHVRDSASIQGNIDFSDSSNNYDNLHVERDDILYIDGDFWGSVWVNTHDGDNLEGQKVGAYAYGSGAENIKSDFDPSFFGTIRDDGAIVLTSGQPVTEETPTDPPAPASHFVTFDFQDGMGTTQGVTVNDGELLYPLDPGQIEGYEFLGWFEDGSDQPFDFANTPITYDLVLRARWNEIPKVEHTVSFDSQCDIPAPQGMLITDGDYAYDPGALAREGYEFLGWFEDGSDQPFDFTNTPITYDILLRARWYEIPTEPETFVVSFSINSDQIPDPENEVVEAGGTAYEPAVEVPEGLIFDGWYEAGATEHFDFDTVISENITLYGTAEPETYTVTFSYNGKGADPYSTVSVTSGQQVTKPADPSAEGFVFNGWFSDAECTAAFDFENTAITSDTVIYAGWKEAVPETFNITWKDYDGTVLLSGSAQAGQIPQYTGEMPSRPSDSEYSYAFDGWVPQPEAVYADAEYTAHYAQTPIPPEPETYTVTFSYNGKGADPYSTVSVTSGQQVTKPADPSAEGYIFGGWYTDTACTQQYSFDTPVTSYLILYAKWTEVVPPVVDHFSVTFYTAHGTVPDGQIVEKNKKVIRPADPAAQGFVFGGWFTDIEYTNPYDFNAPVTADLTLYAKWTEAPTQKQYYKVSFFTERGAAPQEQTVESGSRAFKPADPSADGYVFGGWFTERESKNQYDFNTPVTQNITLFAKWTALPPQNYVVSFNANGHGNAPNPQTVQAGQLVQKPADPSANGYSFTGWFTDAACTQAFNFKGTLSQNLTLFAGWIPNRYTIRFDANGGVGNMQSISCVYDTRYNLPAGLFTRTGFYFIGWNTKADGSGTYLADKAEIRNLTDASGGNVDLFAQWKNIYNVIEGANAKIVKGVNNGITFRTDGDYSKFTGIRIDNNNIAAGQYTSWSGSTYVQIPKEYVNQMSIGTHNIKFMYTDGSCETNFEILSSTPKTGDESNMLLWIIIGAIALILIIAIIILVIGRRRRAYDPDPGPRHDSGYDDDRYDDDRYDGQDD